MPGKIFRNLADDHGRLESWLERVTARPDSSDSELYAAFRAGLLKHIAMEEKILNPIEEGPDGLYAQCEQLAGAEADRILAQLQATPELKVALHIQTAQVLAATRRALV